MLASDVECREDTFTACSCSVLAPTGLTAFCELNFGSWKLDYLLAIL